MKHLDISRKFLLITFIFLVSIFCAISAFADEEIMDYYVEVTEEEFFIEEENIIIEDEVVVIEEDEVDTEEVAIIDEEEVDTEEVAIIEEEEIIEEVAIIEEDEADIEEVVVVEEELTEEVAIIEKDESEVEEIVITETSIEEPAAVTIVDDFDYTFDENVIPSSIRNNEFYRESQRLAKLAQTTYDYGDYDASSGFAEEAIRLAALSDEYVAGQLIIEAKRLLDYADTYNIAALHPNNYNLGKNHYENAVAAHSEEEWPQSIDYGIKAIEVLSVLKAGMSGTTVTTRPTETKPVETEPTGRQYTVRTWAVEKDCLWNIAGYSWVYGDPWKWRLLYEANKSKLPDPNNPDWVEPGIVLDIPPLN